MDDLAYKLKYISTNTKLWGSLETYTFCFWQKMFSNSVEFVWVFFHYSKLFLITVLLKINLWNMGI